MFTEAEKKKLNKKLKELTLAQSKERENFIKTRKLDKEGDAKWDRYVKRVLRNFDKYQKKEFRMARWMYWRALINDRKGRKSPWIIF